MGKLSIKYILAIALTGMLSSTSMAKTTLYYNGFIGNGTGFNTLPSGTGLLGPTLIPPPYAGDCTYTLGNGNLTSNCITKHVPPGGIPGNLYTMFLSAGYQPADPNSPTTPIVISTSDQIITFEFKIGYVHDVTSQAAKDQANYYKTDVHDARLGWGFLAVTSPNSPANLCLGITANKIISYVDGLSQSSSADTTPGYIFVSEKELASYSPGQKVDIKIRVDKVNRTGTYFINGVKKLVVHLNGKLPGDDQTLVSATAQSPQIRNNNPTLDGWSISWVPAISPLYQGKVGMANLSSPIPRNAKGLLDSKAIQTFYGLNLDYPLTYEHPFSTECTPGSGLVSSWTCPNSFVFGSGTQYKMTLYKMKVYSRKVDPRCDNYNGSGNGDDDDGSLDSSW